MPTTNLDTMHIQLSVLLRDTVSSASSNGSAFSKTARDTLINDALQYHLTRAYKELSFDKTCPEYIKESSALLTNNSGYFSEQEYLSLPSDYLFLTGARVLENLVTNGSFEDGTTGWTVSTYTIDTSVKNRGASSFKADGIGVLSLYQTITLTNATLDHLLIFNYKETNGDLKVKLIDNAGLYFNFSSRKWQSGSTQLSLSSSSGSFAQVAKLIPTLSTQTTIKISFENATPTGVYIDDVSFSAVSYVGKSPSNFALMKSNNVPFNSPSSTNPSYIESYIESDGVIKVLPNSLRDNYHYLSYIKTETVSQNTTEISAKSQLRQALVHLAAAFGLQKNNDVQNAQLEMAHYEQMYQMMK